MAENLFINPTFTVTESNMDSGIQEWDGNNWQSTSVTGDEFTSNGTPNGPRVWGGLRASGGPMGPVIRANIVVPEAGESYTFTALVASDAPVTASVTQGVPAKYDGTPLTLTTAGPFTVDPGSPVTQVDVAVTVPTDYTHDGNNGLVLFLESPDATYIRIKAPWVNLTSLVPVDPDPDPDPEPGEVDPLAARVAAHVGRRDDVVTISQASDHLMTVRAFVWGYTRGRGFIERDIANPVSNLEAVIVSACTRLTANPEQVTYYTAGDYSERGSVLTGFTLPELAVLNNYRRRAA